MADFLTAIIIFFAPFFIANRQGDESGFTYFKWYLIFGGGFMVVVFVDAPPDYHLYMTVAIATYGLFFSKKG